MAQALLKSYGSWLVQVMLTKGVVDTPCQTFNDSFKSNCHGIYTTLNINNPMVNESTKFQTLFCFLTFHP